jgi:hypothetical protein
MAAVRISEAGEALLSYNAELRFLCTDRHIEIIDPSAFVKLITTQNVK